MSSSNDERSRTLRENELAFFGAITASVTHEINNVMSIIEQVAGLLEDLCAGAESSRPIEREKILSVHERIAKQIERGVTIIKRLNAFAHSVDEPVKTIELNALIENLIALTERFATLRKLSLKLETSPTIISIKSKPFTLQQALFVCLERMMAESPKDGTISVKFQESGTGARIVLTAPCAGQADAASFRPPDLDMIMEQLQGTCEFKVEDMECRYELSVPHIVEEASK